MNYIRLILILTLILSGCASAPKVKITGFSKIGAHGENLPDEATEWFCVKDNTTGLMWEAKQSQGLHDSEAIFSWFDAFDSTNSFVTQVNAEGLCGYRDWRAPTKSALMTLIDKGKFLPSINTEYFNNFALGKYWSVSKYGYYNLDAWYVDFDYGKTGGARQVTYGHHVILVRTAQ